MARNTQDPGHGDQGWQRSGYRMEDAPCNHATPVSDQNDTGYVEPNREEPWQGDPFGDDGVDEALRDERSSSLITHSSDFWNGPAQVNIERSPEQRKQTAMEKIRKKLSVNQKVVIGFLTAIGCLIVAGVAVFSLLPRIRVIEVQGNSRFTDEQIWDLAGIHPGDNLLNINEEKAKAGIDSQRYLVFVRLEKQWPNQVTLVIREREQFAYTVYNGMTYVMDANAMILEESGDPNAVPDMLEIRGFDVMRSYMGSRLEVRRTGQIEFYRSLCTQLKVMDLSRTVRTCNLASLESIYLYTADGFSVHLGDTSKLHEKLRAMTMVLEWVRDPENGSYTGGTIEVANPGEPTFRPS